MTSFEKSWINPDGAPEISPEELNAKLNEVEIIDVRRCEEFNAELGHIRSARLVTLESEFETELSRLEKNKTYVFVCRSGARSTRATLMAQDRGFKHVYNMQGGMLRWNALGLPIERN